MNKIDKKQIMQALARGYTHKKTENKTLDASLIEAMAEEVMKIYEQII